MFVLIIAVVVGVAIGYFSTQNSTPVTIRIAEYTLNEVPLYLVMVGSLFTGLFVAGILYFARTVSSTITIYGKDHAVKRAKQTVAHLEDRVHELEAENAQLRTEHPALSEAPVRTVRPERAENQFFSRPLFKRTGG
jgi:uncharacterized integral membrane protein